MKNNYAAWSIDPSGFPQTGSPEEQLKFLLGFGILAPSGHNGQPWRFAITGNYICLFIIKERALLQSDPSGRQLSIATGCLLENIKIAADYFNFTVNVELSKKIDSDGPFLKIILQKNGPQLNDLGHLIFSIPNRLSNRYPYQPQKVPEKALLQSLTNSQDQDISIKIISEESKKNVIGKISVDAQIEIMEDKKFREELSGYIKSNWTSENFGMPGFSLDIPGPISPFAQKLIKVINLSKYSKKKDEKIMFKYTPMIGVISSREDTISDWIRTGEVFERLWLKSQKAGLACSPLAGAIQLPKARKKIKQILQTEFLPQVFFRFGYAQKIPQHSPRYPLNEFCQKV